jgi:tRNA A-37 threonylcarbamoyl transferase component Bud32
VATYDVTEDASGVIWIGAETGVYRFANGHADRVSQGAAVSIIVATPDLVVAAMGPLGQGVPTNVSLVRIKRTGDTWKTETVINLDSPGPLTLDRAGNLLYPWPDRGWNEMRLDDVVRWYPGMQVPIIRHPVQGAPGAGPIRVLRDGSGCVWIGSDTRNIYECGESGWRPAPFEGASVRSRLDEAPDGSMVLAGYDVLAVGRPGSFHVAKLANGLPMLYSAIQARDGTLWLAGAQGLYRFASAFRMEYWTARDGVDNPWCVQRSGKTIYAGLNRDLGVLSKDRQHWQHLASFGKNGQVMNLVPSANGTLLAALNPGGAALLRTDGKVLARTAATYEGDYGLRLAGTPNGDTWLGGISLGLLKREGSRLRFENHRLLTQPAGNVLDIQYEDHTRKLWACYNGGLAMRKQDSSWHEISTKDGLLVNPCWSLAALPNGDVWYGYYNTPAFALVRPKADGGFTVRQFRAGDEIQDPESLTLDVDQRGWLWRGGNQGLSVADPDDAEAGKWLHFDQSDGLPGQGVNSGSYFADVDGSLWWGIDTNIFHFLPPSDFVTPRFAPQVLVSAFSWNGGPPKLAEAVDGLPHGVKVVAHIGSLQFDRRNALRLRYRVLPEQPSWHETSNLDLALGKLSWGSHTLEVQARLFTGPWSGTVRRPFTVLRPTGTTWPFVLGYLITAALLSTGGYLLHRRRQADEVELLPNLAAWRLGALLPEVHELVGTVLDSRFEVGEILARGGFANVMTGYDRDQQQRCAVKIFRQEIKDKAWMQRRFEHEVAALQRVRHPNVVSIYAHGTTPSGTPYLVMEFVEGRSLREVLESGALPPGRVARLLRQLAGALEAIHHQNIWHRDVKPENVMIRNEGTPEEEPVLIDFSIAIVKNADETLHGLSRAAGTFAYMAPEQAIGYAQPSSDIYSLAKLVIEMLTGRGLSELLPDAALDLPERVRDLSRSLDISLSEDSIDMLAAALEFDPSRRPPAVVPFASPIVRDLG